MTLEVFTAVGVSDFVFWVMTPCSVLSGYTFRGKNCYLHNMTTRCHWPEDQYPVGKFVVRYNKPTFSVYLVLAEGIQRVFEQTHILALLVQISSHLRNSFCNVVLR